MAAYIETFFSISSYNHGLFEFPMKSRQFSDHLWQISRYLTAHFLGVSITASVIALAWASLTRAIHWTHALDYIQPRQRLKKKKFGVFAV
jgi:hypothetical protein